MKENFVRDLCQWVKNTKGITKLHIEELMSYIPEYQKYLMENETGWTAEHVSCDLCSHKWVCVYHETSDRIECPNCNNMVMFEKLD